MVKRELVEELTQRKIGMIGALWSNSNYDGQENSELRQSAIAELESNFDRAVDAIYGFEPEDENVDWDDPFLAPVRRKMDELDAMGDQQGDGTTAEVIKAEKDADIFAGGYDQG